MYCQFLPALICENIETSFNKNIFPYLQIELWWIGNLSEVNRDYVRDSIDSIYGQTVILHTLPLNYVIIFVIILSQNLSNIS